MRLRVPSYYKEFRCIADRCQDSCCIGWEIDIDEDTFSYYKSVEGVFGERLRSHMVSEDVNSFTLKENGWCPFLNSKKLCDICIELGEEALSEVCTEFPRFTMEYEDVREKILSLSCEEVGRLVFSTDEKITWEERELPEDFYEEICDDAEYEEAELDEDEVADEQTYDDEAWDDAEPTVPADRLETVREEAVSILQDRSKSIFVRAAEYLAYCDRMQCKLYGGCVEDTSDKENLVVNSGVAEFADVESVKENSGRSAYADFLARMERYEQLEVLDETWSKVKEELYATFSEENYLAYQREFLAVMQSREYEYEHLLVYFTFRYFMRAYYDDNIRTKAQFAVASVLMIRDMDVMRYVQNGKQFSLADRIYTARIYSKEVEHSEENMELLAEDFSFEEVFAVERLLEQLEKADITFPEREPAIKTNFIR